MSITDFPDTTDSYRRDQSLRGFDDNLPIKGSTRFSEINGFLEILVGDKPLL
jgi:hypothetical protein